MAEVTSGHDVFRLSQLQKKEQIMKKLICLCAAAVLLLALGVNAEPTPQIQLAQNNQMKVLAPNGGETILVGSTYKILWAAQNDPVTFTIQLSPDGGRTWRNVVEGIKGSERSYNWKVAGPETMTAKIKVSGQSPMAVMIEDESDRTFTIASPSVGPGTK
jgi:hypothetical protein